MFYLQGSKMEALKINFIDPLWSQIPFYTLGVFGKIEFHAWIIKLPIYSFVSFVVAHYSYQYIELPLLGFKDRYFN